MYFVFKILITVLILETSTIKGDELDRRTQTMSMNTIKLQEEAEVASFETGEQGPINKFNWKNVPAKMKELSIVEENFMYLGMMSGAHTFLLCAKLFDPLPMVANCTNNFITLALFGNTLCGYSVIVVDNDCLVRTVAFGHNGEQKLVEHKLTIDEYPKEVCIYNHKATITTTLSFEPPGEEILLTPAGILLTYTSFGMTSENSTHIYIRKTVQKCGQSHSTRKLSSLSCNMELHESKTTGKVELDISVSTPGEVTISTDRMLKNIDCADVCTIDVTGSTEVIVTCANGLQHHLQVEKNLRRECYGCDWPAIGFIMVMLNRASSRPGFFLTLILWGFFGGFCVQLMFILFSWISSLLSWLVGKCVYERDEELGICADCKTLFLNERFVSNHLRCKQNCCPWCKKMFSKKDEMLKHCKSCKNYNEARHKDLKSCLIKPSKIQELTSWAEMFVYYKVGIKTVRWIVFIILLIITISPASGSSELTTAPREIEVIEDGDYDFTTFIDGIEDFVMDNSPNREQLGSKYKEELIRSLSNQIVSKGLKDEIKLRAEQTLPKSEILKAESVPVLDFQTVFKLESEMCGRNCWNTPTQCVCPELKFIGETSDDLIKELEYQRKLQNVRSRARKSVYEGDSVSFEEEYSRIISRINDTDYLGMSPIHSKTVDSEGHIAMRKGASSRVIKKPGQVNKHLWEKRRLDKQVYGSGMSRNKRSVIDEEEWDKETEDYIRGKLVNSSESTTEPYVTIGEDVVTEWRPVEVSTNRIEGAINKKVLGTAHKNRDSLTKETEMKTEFMKYLEQKTECPECYLGHNAYLHFSEGRGDSRRVVVHKLAALEQVQTDWGMISIDQSSYPTYDETNTELNWQTSIKTKESIKVKGIATGKLNVGAFSGLTWTITNDDSDEKKLISLFIYDAAQIYSLTSKWVTGSRYLHHWYKGVCTGDCPDKCDCPKDSSTCHVETFDYDRGWNCNPTWCWTAHGGCSCCATDLSTNPPKWMVDRMTVRHLYSQMIICIRVGDERLQCTVTQTNKKIRIGSSTVTVSSPIGEINHLPSELSLVYHNENSIEFNLKSVDYIWQNDASCKDSCTHGRLGDVKANSIPDFLSGLGDGAHKLVSMNWAGTSTTHTCHRGDWPSCDYHNFKDNIDDEIASVNKTASHLHDEFSLKFLDCGTSSCRIGVQPKYLTGMIDVSIEMSDVTLNRREIKFEMTNFQIKNCEGCYGCTSGFRCEASISVKNYGAFNVHLKSGTKFISIDQNTKLINATKSLYSRFEIHGLSLLNETKFTVCIEENKSCRTTDIRLKEPEKRLLRKENVISIKTNDDMNQSKCTGFGWFSCTWNNVERIFVNAWDWISYIFTNGLLWIQIIIPVLLAILLIYVAYKIYKLVLKRRELGQRGKYLSAHEVSEKLKERLLEKGEANIKDSKKKVSWDPRTWTNVLLPSKMVGDPELEEVVDGNAIPLLPITQEPKVYKTASSYGLSMSKEN